jgi:hypothetical protein
MTIRAQHFTLVDFFQNLLPTSPMEHLTYFARLVAWVTMVKVETGWMAFWALGTTVLTFKLS